MDAIDLSEWPANLEILITDKYLPWRALVQNHDREYGEGEIYEVFVYDTRGMTYLW